MKSEAAKNSAIIDNKAVGLRIREEREKMALTRAELAEFVDLSDYYVGQLERGERQMSLPALKKIAACLHVSMDYLVLGSSKWKEYSIHDSTPPAYKSESEPTEEVYQLLGKCSQVELDLINKLIQTILPYI
jgi:transcriptional regulator with XRE-family HTH domain